jgi:hypothetical protein
MGQKFQNSNQYSNSLQCLELSALEQSYVPVDLQGWRWLTCLAEPLPPPLPPPLHTHSRREEETRRNSLVWRACIEVRFPDPTISFLIDALIDDMSSQTEVKGSTTGIPVSTTDSVRGDWVLFHPVYTPEELKSVQASQYSLRSHKHRRLIFGTL